MNAILAIALQLVPEIPALIAAIRGIRKKYPQLTPAEIQQIVAEVTTQADTAFDDILAKIAADQAANPPK